MKLFNTKERYIDVFLAEQYDKLKLKSLAIEHAIDLIARTISKSEFQVYRKNKKTKKIVEENDHIYYKLNIKPNDNENGTSFIYKIIYKLLSEKECLVINLGENLYVADDFDISNDVIKSKKFKNVTISDSQNNQLKLEKTFNINECWYLELNISQINEELNNFYDDFGKLLYIAANYYKSSNRKVWRLTNPGNQAILKNSSGEIISYDEYKKTITDDLTNKSEDMVLMLSEFFKLESLNGDKYLNSTDYRDMQKMWSDQVANAFNIPLHVYYGESVEKANSVNDFITFAIDPISEILQDELNAKLISKQDYLNGERIVINKLNMKHQDIFDCVSGLDKLMSDGFSHNDLRKFLSMPKLDEEWADEHHITKNYAVTAKGGGINE